MTIQGNYINDLVFTPINISVRNVMETQPEHVLVDVSAANDWDQIFINWEALNTNWEDLT